MADTFGIDHVSIGNDQIARGCVPDYTSWVHVVAAMLGGGFMADERRR
jgi:membrane dipeptidase